MTTELNMPPEHEAYMKALIDMVGRSGPTEFQLRYQDDEEPTVWISVAIWKDHPIVGNGMECGAGLDPATAVYRLAEAIIDGGICVHCGSPAMLANPNEPPPNGPMKAMACWRVYDPEQGTFTVGCEQ